MSGFAASGQRHCMLRLGSGRPRDDSLRRAQDSPATPEAFRRRRPCLCTCGSTSRHLVRAFFTVLSSELGRGCSRACVVQSAGWLREQWLEGRALGAAMEAWLYGGVAEGAWQKVCD